MKPEENKELKAFKIKMTATVEPGKCFCCANASGHGCTLELIKPIRVCARWVCGNLYHQEYEELLQYLES
jgi:hypothetical protein